jgi:WhiB family redox-sensing transcriptional regulator
MSLFLNEPWAERGACVGVDDPELFFPIAADSPARLAKQICSSCPVIVECGFWAVDNPQTGVWGGLNEKERAQLAKHKVASR